MPGYWVASDLARLLPQPVPGVQVITATSNPINLAGAQDLIDMVSAEFNGAAGHAGYLTPIPTGASEGFAYARLIVGYGARWHILNTVYIGPDSNIADEYRTAYQQALEQIREGVTLIPDAPLDTSGTGRRMPRFGGIPSPGITATWQP